MLKKLEPHKALMLKAAVIISEHGLCQGHFEDPGGRVCLLRALELASDVDHNALWTAESVLHSYLGMEIVPWNDMYGRTASEAIAALETAAFVSSQ